MITNSYLQKKKYPSASDRPKSLSKYSSFSHSPSLPSSGFSKSNILKNSEPLNSISRDLSFKGSSIKGDAPEKLIGIVEAVAKYGKEFGSSAADHLTDTIKRVTDNSALTGVKKLDGTLHFQPQSTFQKIKDIVLYPILKLPLDFAIGTLKLIKKIPGLKNSKAIDNLLNSKVFKNRQAEVKLTSEAAALQGFFTKASQTKDDKGKAFVYEAFGDAHGRISPTSSNYSTIMERSVTRLVTGIIPAFFLANDAYNLSMYMKNNKEVAETEKKRRFNQEVARIGITTALTFGVLSFFAKKSNASEGMTNMLMAGVAFVSECFGRASAGNPILPVSAESAKKYAEKRQKHVDNDDKKADKKPSDAFKGNDGKEKNYSHPPEKGALNFGNIIKVIGGLAVFGFGIEKLKGIKAVNEQLSGISKKYKAFFKKDFTISREEFNKLTTKLRKNGFDKVADKYDSMVKDQKGDTLKIGETKKHVETLVIDQALMFPIKFAWNSILMLPYKISKTATKAIINAAKGEKAIKAAKEAAEAKKSVEELAKDAEKEAKEKKQKDVVMLQNSIGYLRKIDEDPNFQAKFNKSLLSGLDTVTKSSYSNADMAATVKTASSTVTSGFLIADSYNMVMIDSQGQDKDLASQKAKERSIQRGVRIAYGAFLVQMFNNIFKTTYDSSLLGAQVVNMSNTVLTEVLERKSVGLPIGESTKEEIIKTENENLHAEGVKGSYYRTMAKLTGKKSLSESAAKKEKDAKKA